MKLSASFGGLNRLFRHILTMGWLFQAIVILVAKHHVYSLALREATVLALTSIKNSNENPLLVPDLIKDRLYITYSDDVQQFSNMRRTTSQQLFQRPATWHCGHGGYRELPASSVSTVLV